MALKINFLYSHLDFRRENIGGLSDERRECIHQDIHIIEKR